MLKIILFGDSITAGYEDGVTDFRLNEEIEANYPNCEVINAGIPGDTTRGALSRLDAHVLKYQPDLVVVFFGANDVSNVIGINIEEYIINLKEIVNQIGYSKVILLGPPYADQRIYSNERSLESITAYNEAVRRIAESNKITYVDVLESMLKQETLSYLQEDGLHFSRKGYQLLGQLINQEIKKKEG